MAHFLCTITVALLTIHILPTYGQISRTGTTRPPRQTTIGPVYYDSVDNIKVMGGVYKTYTEYECQIYCNMRSSCKGYDIGPSGQCYHHSEITICQTPQHCFGCKHYRKTSWECYLRFREMFARNGQRDPSATTEKLCEISCRKTTNCQGFDFSTSTTNPGCFLHFSVCSQPNYLNNVDHFRLRTRKCPTDPEYLLDHNKAVASSEIRGSYNSALACFRLCNAERFCKGVVYDRQTLICSFITTGCQPVMVSIGKDLLRKPDECVLGQRGAWTLITMELPNDWMDSYVVSDCDDDIIRTHCEMVKSVIPNVFRDMLALEGLSPSYRKRIAMKFSLPQIAQAEIFTITEALEEMVRREERLGALLFTHSDIKSIQSHETSVVTSSPEFGPRSGGTRITIQGYNLNQYISVKLGYENCDPHRWNRVLVICMNQGLSDHSLLGQPLDVTTIRGQSTGQKFTYYNDPIISSIEPLSTILSGGVFLSVRGYYMNWVQRPEMEITVSSDFTSQSFKHLTICNVENANLLTCATPDLRHAVNFVKRRKRSLSNNAGDKLSHRSRRRRELSINEEKHLQISIGFRLDGVTEFKQLRGDLEQYGRLTVYDDPLINSLGNAQFVTTWPVYDRTINIKGDKLTALKKVAFLVRIGEETCADPEVFEHAIKCSPPLRRPPIDRPAVGRYSVPVKVIVGSLTYQLGSLDYVENLWYYSPARYIFLGGGAGLLFLLIVIIVCCCICCNKPRDNDSQTSTDERRRGSYHFPDAENPGYRNRERNHRSHPNPRHSDNKSKRDPDPRHNDNKSKRDPDPRHSDNKSKRDPDPRHSDDKRDLNPKQSDNKRDVHCDDNLKQFYSNRDIKTE